MEIEFTPRGYKRDYGLPAARQVNMLAEATPAGPSQTARYSRPGLVSAANVGTGPNRGLFAQAGSFGGALFNASGNAIYLSGASLGSIDGGDLTRSAASTTQRVFAANKKAYLYDGTAFSRIGVAPATVDVIYVDGRFLYLQSGTGRFYYSEVNDAANIGGLNFEDAELKSDPVIGGLVNADVFMLFGPESFETWQPTGDLDTPFERILGRNFEKGAACRDAIKLVDNTAFWVGNDRTVYRASNEPVRVSSHSVEQKLQETTNIGAVVGWTFTFEGHPLYGLNIPGQGTEVFDVSISEWAPWESFARTVFRGVTVVPTLAGPIYFGDDTTNDLWQVTRGAYQDGGLPLVRIASAFAPISSGNPRCNRLAVSCAKGVGSSLQSDPVVEMRYSDDDGQTWSIWWQGALGEQGQYGQRVYWNRLGRMRAPGRAFEFRCSDPVLATFAQLEINGKRP